MSDLWVQENSRADVVVLAIGLCLLAIMLWSLVALALRHKRKTRYKGRHRG